MSITYEQLHAKIQELADAELDLGDAYILSTAYVMVFGGGSGKVVLELFRKDGTNPVETIANMVGATRVEKLFLYDTEAQLLEILEDIQAGIYPCHYDPDYDDD